MNKKYMHGIAVLALVVLSGCAGSNFVRPAEGELVTGKSTQAEVVKRMGNPFQSGEMTKNDKQIKFAKYAYASTGGDPAQAGVTPARSMVFMYYGDKLVAQEFVSSFKQDSSDFDGTKVPTIVKGKTTREEVVKLLGKPAGEAIYPAIKGEQDRALAYSYSHAKGTVFNMKFYSKTLLVSFSPDGVVSDVEYTVAGEQ